MKNFKKLLMLAKMGDPKVMRQITDMYSRLILKESVVDGVFDEDLQQVLYKTLLECVRVYPF